MPSRAKPKLIQTIQQPLPPRTRIRSMGLTDAMLAAEWLNAARGSQTRARVLQIREELATLGAMLDSLSRKTQECSTYLGRRAWRREMGFRDSRTLHCSITNSSVYQGRDSSHHKIV